MSAKLPKGIRQRGGSFLVDVTVDGKRRTATCATLEEAKAKRLELAHKMTSGEAVAQSKKGWTIGETFALLKERVWVGTEYLRTATINCNTAEQHFGADRKWDTITTVDLDNYTATLRAQGLSPATVNRKLAVLSKGFTYAVERGGAQKRPKIEREKEYEGRVRYLSLEEEGTALTILRQWSAQDAEDAFIVLTDTGVRCSELFQRMERRDIDFKTGVVNLWKTKNHKARSVPMTARVREVLTRRAIAVPETGKLFDFPRDTFRLVWDRLRHQMGLDKDDQFVPHVLRHTCASRLVQRYVPLIVVKEWMGHKNVQTTMRYAHLAPTGLLDVVKVLEPGGDLALLRANQTSISAAADVAATVAER